MNVVAQRVAARLRRKFFSISTPLCRYVYDVSGVRDQRPSETAPRVLIADDNGDTREMYALYLNMVMKPCFPEQLAREVGACLTAPRNRATSAL